MLEDELLRHHRYELHIKQVAKFGYRLSTVAAGRFRFDTALLPEEQASREFIDRAVREDEMAEAELPPSK